MLASVVRENLFRIEVPSVAMNEADTDKTVDAMANALPALWNLMAHYHASSLLSNRTITLPDHDNNTPPLLPPPLPPPTLTTTSVSPTLSGDLFNASNSSFLSNDSDCSPRNAFMTALPWIRITFGLLMVLENAFSLLALWYVKRMQTAIHRFISSLAVADLLMGVWNCYRYSAEILIDSNSQNFECRLRFLGNTYLNFAAILSVCALCLDRCIALHFPFRYVELVTKKRIRIALVVVWFLPVLFVLTAYLETQEEICEGCSFIHVASQRTYIVLTIVRCFLIALIIVAELLIFRSARCQITKIHPHVLSSRNSNRFLRMNAKAAITTLAVVVPLVLLYFPVLFVQGNLAARPHTADTCQGQLLSFVWLVASAHGLFTPIIFCWRFTEVRQNLVRLLCCVRTSASHQSSVFNLRTTNDSAMTA